MTLFIYLLFIFFLAQALGLPLVAPYVGDGPMDLEKGANLAFAGATALNSSFLEEIGMYTVSPNISLRAQLNLFKTILPRVCSTSSGNMVVFIYPELFMFCPLKIVHMINYHCWVLFFGLLSTQVKRFNKNAIV